MENVVLTIHLILALCLIGVVLLQRSEGGGLGLGGGGGAMSGRQAATALAKMTWIFAVAFICTSIALTIIAASKGTGASVVERFGGTVPTGPAAPLAPEGDLLPPSPSDAPLTPPRADAPAPAPSGSTTTTP